MADSAGKCDSEGAFAERAPHGSLTLREFVDALRDLGELVDVTRKVDPSLELGAIIRRTYDLRAPAPLFHSLSGSRPGDRVLGAPVGLSARRGYECAASLCRLACVRPRRERRSSTRSRQPPRVSRWRPVL